VDVLRRTSRPWRRWRPTSCRGLLEDGNSPGLDQVRRGSACLLPHGETTRRAPRRRAGQYPLAGV